MTLNRGKKDRSLPDRIVSFTSDFVPPLHILLDFLHSVIPFFEVWGVFAFHRNSAEQCIVFRDVDIMLIVHIDKLLRLYVRVEYLSNFWDGVQIFRTAGLIIR